MDSLNTNPVDVVMRLLTAMQTNDYDTALSCIGPNCEYENMPIGKVVGPAGVRAVLEPFFSPTSENEFIILRQVSSGPTVFMERLDRHHLPDRWVELPVNGVWEVHDGLITLWHDYFDLGTLARQWPYPLG